MGIYDRDYYRDESGSQGFRLRAPQSMVVTLVLINAAVFLAGIFFPREADDVNLLTHWLSLKPDALLAPWRWWEFLTFGFVHSQRDIFHILGNMFVLWMFGRFVEPIYGKWELLRFYLVAVVLGGVVWAARIYVFYGAQGAEQFSLLGASGAVTAVLILFICRFPRQTILLFFVIPMPAWVLGVVIIVSDVFRLRAESGIAADVHLVGAAFGLLYYFLGWNLGRLVPGAIRFDWLRRATKRSPKLRVHQEDAPPRDSSIDEEADRLLDKVHREGEESLTNRERRTLEEYSRRMRERRGL